MGIHILMPITIICRADADERVEVDKNRRTYVSEKIA